MGHFSLNPTVQFLLSKISSFALLPWGCEIFTTPVVDPSLAINRTEDAHVLVT